MTFSISRASCMCPAAEPMSYHVDNTCAECIDINTIEELQRLANLTNTDLIIRMKGVHGSKHPSISIYDSYIE